MDSQQMWKFGVLLVLATCSCGRADKATLKEPTVHSVKVDELVKDKTRAPVEQQEVVPTTYYELAAWAGDASRTPDSAVANGIVGPGTDGVCLEALGTDSRCQIRASERSYTLRPGEAVTFNSNSSASLACVGTAPVSCKAWFIHPALASK